MDHTISWFEIPVKDMNRAKRFYEEIFNIELSIISFGGHDMAFFPSSSMEQISGALVQGPDYTPSSEGSLIYFSGNPDLQKVLNRIPDAGGVILLPKREISPEYGFMALFMDTEGNRLALHSLK
ncbi:VOC family protein [Ignavibacteriales bacterium]